MEKQMGQMGMNVKSHCLIPDQTHIIKHLESTQHWFMTKFGFPVMSNNVRSNCSFSKCAINFSLKKKKH